ncbi:MAG: hypothetical protein GQ525_15445, partial [Draconibacterium sp.]|nr:hypothetical protein [Draconibacterium sp.]
MGMFNPKGRMRFSFGTPLEMIDIENVESKSKEQQNKIAQNIAEKIDR